MASARRRAPPSCGLGSIFNRYRRYDAAYDAYTKALTLNPDQERAMTPRIYAKMQLCDWTNLDAEFASTLSALRKDILVGDPFSLLCVPVSPEDQFRCAGLFAKATVPPAERPIWTGERYKHGRIQIAHLSSDLRNLSHGGSARSA
jgi:protein O-GlcNAc transferase